MRTYDAAYGKEPDHNLDSLSEPLHIRTGVSVDIHGLQKLYGNVEVEDCRDTHGSKEAHEYGLMDLFDLRDQLVDSKDPREASKEEHQDAERHKAVNGDDLVVREAWPWTDNSIPSRVSVRHPAFRTSSAM